MVSPIKCALTSNVMQVTDEAIPVNKISAEILQMIFSFLDVKAKLAATKVSSDWRENLLYMEGIKSKKQRVTFYQYSRLIELIKIHTKSQAMEKVSANIPTIDRTTKSLPRDILENDLIKFFKKNFTLSDLKELNITVSASNPFSETIAIAKELDKIPLHVSQRPEFEGIVRELTIKYGLERTVQFVAEDENDDYRTFFITTVFKTSICRTANWTSADNLLMKHQNLQKIIADFMLGELNKLEKPEDAITRIDSIENKPLQLRIMNAYANGIRNQYPQVANTLSDRAKLISQTIEQNKS